MVSRSRSKALAVVIALTLLGLPRVLPAINYDSGGVVNITTNTSTSANVINSMGGAPTFLNGLPGAGFTTVNVRGLSVVNLVAGSSSSIGVNAFDNATLRIYGGNQTSLDSSGNAHVFVADGSFATNSGVVGIASGHVEISGGTFQKLSGGTTISVEPTGELRLCGGTLIPNPSGIAFIDARGLALIEGGSFNKLEATSMSFLYGTGFEARDLANQLVQSGPGVLAGQFEGTITGTLADGTPLDIEVFVPTGANITLFDPLGFSICAALPPPPTGATLVPIAPWSLGVLGAVMAATFGRAARRSARTAR